MLNVPSQATFFALPPNKAFAAVKGNRSGVALK